MSIQGDVRLKLVSIINGLNPGIGNVFDRYKYSSEWQTFLNQFLYRDPITGTQSPRGWWISLPTIVEWMQGRDFDTHWHTHTYPIRGILGLSDKANSEETFDVMIDKVFEALHDQGVLGNGPGTRADAHYVIDGSVEIEVPIVEPRMFGSVLCHYCEMRLQVGIAHPVVNVP